MLEVILQMGLAVLAVFGLYCLIRLLIENRFPPKGLLNAVVLSSREDILYLPERIAEIHRRLSSPSGILIVLVPESLYSHPEIREDLDAVLIGCNAEILVFGTDEEILLKLTKK